MSMKITYVLRVNYRSNENVVSSSIIFTENEVDNFFDKESSNYSSSDDDDE